MVAGVAPQLETWAAASIEDALLDRVARTIASFREADRGAAAARVAYGDLALAAACVAGDEAALAALVRLVRTESEKVVARTRNQKIEPEDLDASARERLLTGPSPKIAEYDGSGELKRWLKTLLVRLSLDLTRRRTEQPASDASERLDGIMPATDPEVRYLKTIYRGAFKGAFERAAQSLEAEDRALLKMHHGSGKTVDELAALLGVHRATAARRVAKARDDLVAATKRELMASLRLSPREYESVMRLIESEIDLSLERVL